MDATCTPADIRYPTDMSILNESRINTERFIDFLYEEFRSEFQGKPRDYREIAHKDFIAYAKKRKPRCKVRRKAIRRQLGFLKRNIGHVERMMSQILDLDDMDYKSSVFAKLLRLKNRFQTICKIYEQQLEMYTNHQSRVDDRIVSVSQPHIRPIVRGKAGKSVEFGAKISMSVVDGFCFIDHLSWDSFNESQDLIGQIEKYKVLTGYYPESVHADKIYQTRKNKSFCASNEIRMTGKALGRPSKETQENKERLAMEKRQRYQDDVDRIIVEGRFGNAKRKYGMGLIKSKLKETSETDINLSVFVLNLDRICAKEMNEIKAKYRVLLKNVC